MNAFWTSAGNRESLQLKGFKSTENKRARSAQPLLFWKNGPRGSTDRPMQSFSREPMYTALADHPGRPLGPLNHNRSSDYRTNASLSTYPFRWRTVSQERVWAPRQSTLAREAGHPGKILAAWDHGYSHQNTHWSTHNFQYGSFWYDEAIQPKPRVFNQTQPGAGWYPVVHGTRP